ncbi:MAG: glycosyltransferase [Vicinamibacteraceae bacterium]
MRILWLNANLLLPLDKGGKIRTWHLMRHLARRHHITYLTFANDAETAAHRPAMREVCSELVNVPWQDAEKGSLRFYAGVAAHLVDPLPYAVAKYRSAVYRHSLEALLEHGGFDRMVCDFLVPAVNLRRTPPCPSILFTHNVEAEIWRRHAENATGTVSRELYRQQWRRMLRFEGRTLSRFDRVLAVSEADDHSFRRLYGKDTLPPIDVVATGVDTSFFTPTPESFVRPKHLAFVGSMDWMPNEDAVLFFCREVLPRVRQAEPDVTLSIIGRAPTAAVKRLAQEAGVEVTGTVDDVRAHLGPACATIVPLRVGGGTRLKIFEAMAAGKAVVSTTIGAEGLPTESGRHLLIADGAADFAAAVLRVIREPELRRRLEREARTLVTTHYDWSVAAGQLERSLIDAAVADTATESAFTSGAAAARTLS